MKVSFNRIDERTYTVGDTQYWKRNGKAYKWTESGGRVEISEDEYFQAIASTGVKPVGSSSHKSERRKVEKPSDYKKATAEDLALLTQDGDKRAEETLLTRFTPLVYKIANKYFLTGGDKDDLVQDGLIGLWDAIKVYDEERNGDFMKYASQAIDKRLQISIRDDNTGKNSALNSYSSIDTPTGSDDGEGRTLGDTIGSKEPSPEEQYLGKDGAQKLMTFMREELAGKERDVIFRFINGSNIREIADETGMSYKAVENALMRARNKIKEFRASMEESLKIRENVGKSLRIRFRKVSKDLNESSFEHGGKIYKCAFGHYTCDGEPISREDYFAAKDVVDKSTETSEDRVYSEEDVVKVDSKDLPKYLYHATFSQYLDDIASKGLGNKSFRTNMSSSSYGVDLYNKDGFFLAEDPQVALDFVESDERNTEGLVLLRVPVSALKGDIYYDMNNSDTIDYLNGSKDTRNQVSYFYNGVLENPQRKLTIMDY